MGYSKEQSQSPERSENFFSRLALRDIYGKENRNPAKIKISKELSQKLTSKDHEVAQEEIEKFVTKHNLNNFGGISNVQEEFQVRESPISFLSYWTPSYQERMLILDLAGSLCRENKPFILETACGSGFVSRLIATNYIAKVTGIDPSMNSMGGHKIPQTEGDIQFLKQDLWDVIEQFEPNYKEKTQLEKRKLLQSIKTQYQRETVFEFSSYGGIGIQIGNPAMLSKEIKRLQELSNEKIEESPVDMVLCSFMPPHDLTVPIRDGINPRCILYVRPTNGMSGAGDYYYGEILNENHEDAYPSPNTAISYNPGKHYKTLTAWRTTSRNNWSCYQDPPGFECDFDTEVIVQLRDDVELKNKPPVHIEKYEFDKELESALNEVGSLEEFMMGIKESRKDIFKSK